VSFAGYTTFAKSHFKGAANFQAMKAERAFSLESTSFEAVPDFIQAHFAEAPRLDNANFKNLGGDRRQADTSLPARFRALKRLAVSGHDTERELEFNAAEILSRRHVEDHPFGRNAARFWLGWLYQEVSDFGRSIVKPIRLWLLLSVLFALLYLGPWTGRDISLHGLSSCVEVPNRHLTTPVPIRLSTNAVWEALQLSFRNGAFVFGSADANVEWNTLGCLYGASEDHPNVRRMPRTAAAAAMAQRTLSATLIFLFGMALRNMLKMK
jgi:hypothetical protein